MNWTYAYQSQIVTPQKAVQVIKSGDRIFLSGNASVPQKVLSALANYALNHTNKENIMKKEIGLWIDHRKAVIVTIENERNEIITIKSNLEKHVRFSGEEGPGEDVRDRKFENHLNHYYDRVIAHVRDADTILLFGPSEAKRELEKLLKKESVKAHILPVETNDKMTNRQILAKVQKRFSFENIS